MDSTGSSPGNPADAPGEGLAVVKKRARYAAEDPLIVERRRKIAARLRFVEHLTEQEIVDQLAKLDPPIICSRPTISRDLHLARRHYRHYLSMTGFDAAAEVHSRLMAYEEREQMCMKLARDKAAANDPVRITALIREANRCTVLSTRLLQEIGFLDRKLGTLMIGDKEGKRVDSLPSGADLQKLFNETNVVEGEIMSEAELAWKYGDAATSKAAGNAATDSARDEAAVDSD
jgi:hypothetical protein